MRPTNMKKAILKTQTASGVDGGSGLAARGDGSRCGSWHHGSDVQPDGATGLPQPAGWPDDLLVGIRLHRRARRLCAGGMPNQALQHHAGSRSHADRHGRADGHG